MIDLWQRLMNFLRARSLRTTITLVVMALAGGAVLMIGSALYSRFQSTAQQNAMINTRQMVDQVNLSLDNYLNGMREVSDSLRAMVADSQEVPREAWAQHMKVLLSMRKDIVSLALFDADGNLVLGSPVPELKPGSDVRRESWFTAPLEDPQTLYFSAPHVQNLFYGQHSWVVTLSREVTFHRGGKAVSGVLTVEMNLRTIDELCQRARLGKKGYIYLIDDKGTIVYHPQQQLIFSGLKTENIQAVTEHVFGRFYDTENGRQRLITVDTVNYSRWRIVGIAYMDEILTTWQDIGRFVVFIIALGMILTVLVAALLASRILRPIRKLEQSMEKVRHGDFTVNVDIPGDNEVARLADAFNAMVARIRTLMQHIVRDQESIRRKEFEVLQSQINPHFLYNTLNSVVRLIGSGRADESVTMITALSKLFRISLSKGRNIISVRDELEHARNYLTIQKIRYKNKFTWELKIQEDVLEYQTVKLILQPVIENAIYHGIEPMVDEGHICVSARLEDGQVILEVADNGVGMKEDIRSRLTVSESKSQAGSGVGTKNVHDRMVLCYGPDYGVRIRSAPEEGTVVQLVLPAKPLEEVEP